MSDPVILDEALPLMQRMADDLQEYVNAAEEAGSDAQVTKALLEEYEAFWRRTPFHWVERVQGADEATKLNEL